MTFGYEIISMTDFEVELKEKTLQHISALALVGVHIKLVQQIENNVWWKVEADFSGCEARDSYLTMTRHYITFQQACGMIEGIAIGMGIS